MSKDIDNLNRLCTDVPNSIRIDSLKIRIPLSLVSVKDISLFNFYSQVCIENGEIDEETDAKRKLKEYTFTRTAKVKVGISKLNTSPGINEECLIILLNSKFLRERYFQGIHFDLIKDVYNDLISLNIFDVDFETFVRSECTDIDFKFDEFMSQDTWNTLLDEFKKLTIPSAQLDKGFARFSPTKKHPLNNGLQYNKRATATKSRPFLKLYWKGGELLSQSQEFYNDHLKGISEDQVKELVRIETTIKNKEHAKTLGIENTTLLSLLSLTEASKEKMFQKIISKHLHRPKRIIEIEASKDSSKLSPTQQVEYNAIVSLMSLAKLTAADVIETLLQRIECPVGRSRKKAALTEIYELHIKGNKTDISAEKINSFFTKFGWS
jgi:hypothetical protein